MCNSHKALKYEFILIREENISWARNERETIFCFICNGKRNEIKKTQKLTGEKYLDTSHFALCVIFAWCRCLLFSFFDFVLCFTRYLSHHTLASCRFFTIVPPIYCMSECCQIKFISGARLFCFTSIYLSQSCACKRALFVYLTLWCYFHLLIHKTQKQ